MTELLAWIEANPIIGALVFVAFATFGKVTPVPGGAVILLSAGFLFGPIVGPLLGVLGGALAALLVAALGRRFLFERLASRFGHRLGGAERAVGEDGFWWLLSARLVPILPAWLVNLVPVLLPIRRRVVFSATAVGLVPIAFALGSVGDELTALARDDSLADVRLSPRILVPLLGLALLSLVPIAIKRRRRRAQD